MALLRFIMTFSTTQDDVRLPGHGADAPDLGSAFAGRSVSQRCWDERTYKTDLARPPG